MDTIESYLTAFSYNFLCSNKSSSTNNTGYHAYNYSMMDLADEKYRLQFWERNVISGALFQRKGVPGLCQYLYYI